MNRRDVMYGLPALALTGTMAAAGTDRTANSAAQIGRRLLLHRTSLPDRKSLSAQVAAARKDGGISAAIRSDFAAGRVVSVDGWIISQTEACFCMLAALDAGFRGQV